MIELLWKTISILALAAAAFSDAQAAHPELGQYIVPPSATYPIVAETIQESYASMESILDETGSPAVVDLNGIFGNLTSVDKILVTREQNLKSASGFVTVVRLLDQFGNLVLNLNARHPHAVSTLDAEDHDFSGRQSLILGAKTVKSGGMVSGLTIEVLDNGRKYHAHIRVEIPRLDL